MYRTILVSGAVFVFVFAASRDCLAQDRPVAPVSPPPVTAPAPSVTPPTPPSALPPAAVAQPAAAAPASSTQPPAPAPPSITQFPATAAAANAPGQRCVQHRSKENALNEVNVELRSSSRATGADLVSASYFMPAGGPFKVAINEPYIPTQRYFAYVQRFIPHDDHRYTTTVNMDGFIESAAIGSARIPDNDALVKGNLIESGSTLLTLQVPNSIGGFWEPVELYVWRCTGETVASRSVMTTRGVSWYAAAVIVWPLVLLLYALAAVATRVADVRTGVPLYRYLDPVYMTAGSDGRGSLSKLQILFFSLIVFGLLSYILARTGALSDLSSSILYLLGITGIGSGLAKGTDEQKNRLSSENRAWLILHEWLPEAGWRAVNKANWHDIITNDDGEFDVYRYQSCIFSLTVGAALLVTGVNELASFTIPDTLLGILGLSQAVYIGGKAVSTSAVAEFNNAVTSLREAEQHYGEAMTGKPGADPAAAASLRKSAATDYENKAKYAKILFESLTDRKITDTQLKPAPAI